MKLSSIVRPAFMALALATLFTSANAATIVGSGPDVSYLVIEATQFGTPIEYDFHYTYNAASPLDTYAMLTAIDAAESNLSFDFTNYGSASSPNYFLNSITYNSATLANADVFWAQWVSGGKSSGSDVASGTWTDGNGISSPYRTLTPGSWDGLDYNGDFNPDPPYNLTSPPPSISPVPEPSTFVLLGLGGILGFALSRRRA